MIQRIIFFLIINKGTSLYKNIAITKEDRLKPLLRQSQNMHSWSFIVPSCKTPQIQESFSFVQYLTYNQLPQSIVWSGLVKTFKAAVKY